MDKATKIVQRKMSALYTNMGTRNNYLMVKALRDEGSLPELDKILSPLSDKDCQDAKDLFLLDCPTSLLAYRPCGCGGFRFNEFPDGKQVCTTCGSLRGVKGIDGIK
uniref:Uncharacterized protein n=1 Tax=viral metagenome TaxID=1070528 RepID=A0A6M3JL66_9ZZZZ